MLNRDQIRDIFIANGFTIKDGQTDLKDYVYKAAEALLIAQNEQSSRLAEAFVDTVFTATPLDFGKCMAALTAAQEAMK